VTRGLRRAPSRRGIVPLRPIPLDRAQALQEVNYLRAIEIPIGSLVEAPQPVLAPVFSILALLLIWFGLPETAGRELEETSTLELRR